MNTDNIERYLNSFGQNVVEDSKKFLYSKKGNTALGKSIRFKVVPTATGFSTKFYMDDYGTFIDKGVSGTKKIRRFKNYEGKVITSPYKFGTGSSKVGKAKGGMSGIMAKWAKRKGFQWKNKETGKFMSHKSMGYLIARSIFSKGIKGISFFQRPLELGMKDFPKEMLGAVRDDIINGLTTIN